MVGTDFYNLTTNLLNGFQMDTVTFYTLLNVARIRREMMRPFMALRKVDTSNTIVAVSNNPLVLGTAYSLPSDFLFLSKDGTMTFYNNNQIWQDYSEVPLDMYVSYLQISNTFTINYGTQKFYVLGTVDQQYTAYIPYQANLGDITATTSWLNIPTTFQPILSFDVAVMYRMGQSYDDINARNADRNNIDAETLFNAMCTWDNNLQRSSVTRLDYPTAAESVTFRNRSINTNG